MKIINGSLMCGPPENGFTSEMRRIATEGYWPLLPGEGFSFKLYQMVLELKPELVFVQVQCGGVFDPTLAKEIAKHTFVMQFSGDIRHWTEDFYFQIGQNIQLTAFTNQRDVDNCRERGIHAEYLELGFNPKIYRPLNIPKVPQDAILMMFNNYGGQFELSGYRAEIVHTLRTHFPGQVGVYGTGWNGIESGDLNHSQEAENEKNNQGLIGISISHFNAQRYNSDRLLRMLGSGLFTISHHFPGIELDYEVGKHLVTYSDTNDLIEKINYYLNHPQEREAIAKAGCEHAHANFTFKNMCENIKNLYYQQNKNGK